MTESIKASNRINRPIVNGFIAIEAVNVVAVIVRKSRDRVIL